MIKKAMLTVALMVGVSSYALAESSTSPSTASPPGSSSGTMSNSSNSAPMTEAQVKSKLESEGYSNISISLKDANSSSQPMWAGTAIKGGKQVNIRVVFAPLGSSSVKSTGLIQNDPHQYQ